MAPDVYAAFVRSFAAKCNAAPKGRPVVQDSQRGELKLLDRKIVNLVSVLAERGGSAATLADSDEAGRVFRFEAGQHSNMKAATVPI